MGLRNRHYYKEFNCFFVTTACVNHTPIIEQTNSYRLLEHSLMFVSKKYKADILAYVIMPNHIHLIIYFKAENRLSDFMRDFKKYTSVEIIRKVIEQRWQDLLTKLKSSSKGRKFQVWQHRFDDVFLESKWLIEQKLDYIHSNPLQEQWQLVKDATDYEYSSAKFYYLDQQPNVKITNYGKYF